MIDILEPLSRLETRARHQVYLEYVNRHRELEHVVLGCHNDMIMLVKDPTSEAAVAILFATGTPGQLIEFPRHRHTKGEWTACLEGTYGEYVGAEDPLSELAFVTTTSLSAFQQQYPETVELLPPDAGKVPVLLRPGAVWAMGTASEHKPYGFVGASGLLLAQISWPGPNVILS